MSVDRKDGEDGTLEIELVVVGEPLSTPDAEPRTLDIGLPDPFAPLPEAPNTQNVAPPERLGRYALVEVIGKGGMAEVFLAHQDGPAGFKKTCVVKRIRRSMAEVPRFVDMFLREARMAARLNHPNVVQIFELGQEGADYFIAMEFLDGVSLHRAARRAWAKGESVPMEVALRAITDAAQGLHHAHTNMIDGRRSPLIHRDVSPDNIILTRDGVSKVLDFGIAKSNEVDEVTSTGEVKGKIPFMSPEQLHGAVLDQRTDLWSLGVTMYWLLTGSRPFDGQTEPMTIDNIVRNHPTPPCELNPLIPPPLENIILALLEKDRDKRTATGMALSEQITALLGPSSSSYAPAARFASKVLGWPDVAGDAPPSVRTISSASAPESEWLKRIHAESSSSSHAKPRSRPALLGRLGPTITSAGKIIIGVLIPTTASGGNTTTMVKALVPRVLPRALAVLAFLGTIGAVAAFLFLPRAPPTTSDVDPRSTPPPSSRGVVSTAAVVLVPAVSLAPPSVPPAVVATPARGDDRISVVAANAPKSVAWKVGGRTVGNGSGPLKVPRGTTKLNAVDSATGGRSTVFIESGAADWAALGTGTLIVKARPWANVALGPKALGETPLDAVRLTAGTYTLRFSNEDGKVVERTIDVASGKETTVIVKMDE